MVTPGWQTEDQPSDLGINLGTEVEVFTQRQDGSILTVPTLTTVVIPRTVTVDQVVGQGNVEQRATTS